MPSNFSAEIFCLLILINNNNYVIKKNPCIWKSWGNDNQYICFALSFQILTYFFYKCHRFDGNGITNIYFFVMYYRAQTKQFSKKLCDHKNALILQLSHSKFVNCICCSPKYDNFLLICWVEQINIRIKLSKWNSWLLIFHL